MNQSSNSFYRGDMFFPGKKRNTLFFGKRCHLTFRKCFPPRPLDELSSLSKWLQEVKWIEMAGWWGGSWCFLMVDIDDIYIYIYVCNDIIIIT